MPHDNCGARFQAERAHRQFDAVEPENRLVGRTLERTLEEALVTQREAEAELAAQRMRRPTRLSDEEVAWLERAGADVRAIFHAKTTSWRERKQLLRAIVAEVVVTERALCSGNREYLGIFALGCDARRLIRSDPA